jgi:hypothetical protein
MSMNALTPFDADAIAGQMPPANEPAEETQTLSQILATMPAPEPVDVPRGLSSPLDKRAKFHLSSLARQTFAVLARLGTLPIGEDLATFRRRISVAACGRRISEACLGDRMKIQAAFLSLTGDTRAAEVAQAKAVATAETIALFKLKTTCQTRGFSADYAEGIARRIYKRPLYMLSAKEIWTVIFTVTNNANARDKKGNPEARFKSLRQARQTSKSTPSL